MIGTYREIIENCHFSNLPLMIDQPNNTEDQQTPENPTLEPQATQESLALDHTPYRRLKELLVERSWEEADRETWSVMGKVYREEDNDDRLTNRWKLFGKRVGWHRDGNWIMPLDYTGNIADKTLGYLPSLGGDCLYSRLYMTKKYGLLPWWWLLLSRVEECGLPDRT